MLSKKLTAIHVCLALCFSIFSLALFAQQRTVTGTVKNVDDNSPLVAATVSVRGTNVSTLTDANGNFAIRVPNGRNVITVSSVGYESIDINIGNRNEVSVTLKSTVSTMNEVVVTGYSAQRKKDITGSIAVVDVNNLKKVPVGTGEEALQGQASGVTIISSAQPGAVSDIRIRGITGFGNNQPLIVIDGVQGGDLHNINVNDIESIQVLKDASAAIYGVAGSTGVIIVTTRKGKTGRAKVSYDGYYGVATQGKGYDMANTQQEANAIWQQMINSGLTPGDPAWGRAQFGKGASPVIPDYISVYDPTSLPGNPKSMPGYVLCNCPADSVTDPRFYDINKVQITRANKVGTNWYKEITRNAPVQNHNVSVSAGSDRSSYFFSMNYLDQEGILKYSYNKRYSVRANTQFNIQDHVRVGENAYIYYSSNPIFFNNGENSPFSMAFREDAIIPVYDIMGNFAGTKAGDLGNARNVYADVYRTKDNHSNTWNVEGNVYADVDFLKHFTFHTAFGGILNNNYYWSFNYVGYENAEGNTGNNSFNEGSSYNSNWTYTNTLTYANTFGNHSIKVLGGTEAVSAYGRGLSGTRANYFSENPNFWQLNTGGSSGQANTGYSYQNTLYSLIGHFEYAYAGKYLINGSIRRDGSSVFVGPERYSNFPSVSAAWRISQEDFMKGIVWLNDLKLRYSWGKLGNQRNVLPTNAYNLYASSPGRSYYDLGGTSTLPLAGFFASNIGNPKTTFEGDIISNAGFDATMFHSKIEITADWYKKKVSGLLFDAGGPPYDVLAIGDASVPKVNIADMQNTGIDGSIAYHGSLNKDLRFDVTGTFTSYKNKILSLPGVNYRDAGLTRNVSLQRDIVGHPVNSFFGYKVIGLFQDAADVAKSPQQKQAEPGVFKYADINGDGVIDDKDRTIIGDPNPKFTYGLNIGIAYKNFDFSTFFYGSYGNDIFNNNLYFTDFPDFFKGAISRNAALNAWTPQHTNTNVPKLRTTGSFSTDAVTNSYFISSGSYLRNKQMQIGYTFPKKMLSRYGIDRLRIYVQSANMFTITKYNGLDPELSSPSASYLNGQTNFFPQYGIDQGNYPHTPSYLVGINLNF